MAGFLVAPSSPRWRHPTLIGETFGSKPLARAKAMGPACTEMTDSAFAGIAGHRIDH